MGQPVPAQPQGQNTDPSPPQQEANLETRRSTRRSVITDTLPHLDQRHHQEDAEESSRSRMC